MLTHHESNLLTLAEAADYLRCSRSKLYKCIERRELNHFKLGNRAMFRREDLDSYIERCFVPELPA